MRDPALSKSPEKALPALEFVPLNPKGAKLS
jgi:hypothetical protein